ncbi:DUF3850 domain-containing protein [Candidatus Woesearchaeota archaeon]|nr:DUF3850 domain-containing protein [Candidatus Woesearchaeota archaeon]
MYSACSPQRPYPVFCHLHGFSFFQKKFIIEARLMKIYKKVQKEYFGAIVDGRKRFEIRLADFECSEGDTLVLQEQKPGSSELSGREINCEILYNFNTKDMEKFHSKEEIEKHGFVVLAIRKKFEFDNNKV